MIACIFLGVVCSLLKYFVNLFYAYSLLGVTLYRLIDMLALIAFGYALMRAVVLYYRLHLHANLFLCFGMLLAVTLLLCIYLLQYYIGVFVPIFRIPYEVIKGVSLVNGLVLYIAVQARESAKQ